MGKFYVLKDRFVRNVSCVGNDSLFNTESVHLNISYLKLTYAKFLYCNHRNFESVTNF
jgi:hypothetical protein